MFDILIPKYTSLDDFYSESKNSLDVFYVGSSNVNNNFNSVLAYKEYGFTTAMLSSESQHFSSILHLIKEGLKYQNPKVVVIDISRIKDMIKVAEMNQFQYFDQRKTIDALKFSKNKISAIYDLIKYDELSFDKYMTFFMPHLIYHDSWKEVTSTTFGYGENGWYRFIKGYQYNTYANQTNSQKRVNWHNDTIELTDRIYEMLTDLLTYLKEENLDTIFVLPAAEHSNYDISIFNTVIPIIESYRFDVLNFASTDDYGVDYENDFFEPLHYNAYGAIRFTLYFSDYLKNKYDLIDHRSDNNYSSWEDGFKKFEKIFEEETGNKLEDYIIKKGK